MRRSWGKSPLVALCLVSACVGLASCQDPLPPPPVAPPEIVPPPAIDPKLGKDRDPAVGSTDYFYEVYHDYMHEDQRADYRRTRPDERFQRFGLRLLDYELRADLLRDHEEELTREERDAYKLLPDAQACRDFIAQCAARARKEDVSGTGAGTGGGTGIAPEDSSTRRE